MKILAFAATSSSQSINKQLIGCAVNFVKDNSDFEADIEVIDINDFEMPLYSVDREQAIGIPDLARQFFAKIGQADVLLISFAEHNGFYTTAYKNLFDWTSRVDMKVYQNKLSIYMATSVGKNGGQNVLEVAKNSAPHFGAKVMGEFSLASFHDNFNSETLEITDSALNLKFQSALRALTL